MSNDYLSDLNQKKIKKQCEICHKNPVKITTKTGQRLCTICYANLKNPKINPQPSKIQQVSFSSPKDLQNVLLVSAYTFQFLFLSLFAFGVGLGVSDLVLFFQFPLSSLAVIATIFGMLGVIISEALNRRLISQIEK
ncbi:MAG: hypothetical protein ACTSUV_00205 [Candidatus Ranarchaeia archaeon]